MTRPRRNKAATATATEGTGHEVPEQYLDCRDLGHAWQRHRAIENKKYNNFTRVVTCSRCNTERIQVISQAGFLSGTSYRYPTGYLIKGHGIWTTDDRARMRLRNLRRVMG